MSSSLSETSSAVVKPIEDGVAVQKQIIPGKWKFWAAVAPIFILIAIVFAFTTGQHGVLPTADWIATGLKYSAAIVGLCYVVAMGALYAYYRNESQARELTEHINEAKAEAILADKPPEDPLRTQPEQRIIVGESSSEEPSWDPDALDDLPND